MKISQISSHVNTQQMCDILGLPLPFIHSFIYYAFIKSTQGLAPSRYRTCHRIIQKYNTNINHTVLAKRLGYIYHLLQDATEIWLYPFNQNKDKGFNPN
jgi:hypothetical protein